MAIYRLSADVVKRSEGRTVTAAAAYRAGICITDERTGLVFDYVRRKGVIHTAIMAPANTAAWMVDRARLWNAVERAEKRKDAQLARDITLALPHELMAAQRLALVRDFVTSAFVSDGMVADIAIHAPCRRDADKRNHHAHILLTLRAIEGDGFGAKIRAWNDKAKLEAWRMSWAEHVNRALEEAGEVARVDHRSLAAQGIERIPQPKLSPAVKAMEERGMVTELGDALREVEAINAALVRIEEPTAAPEPVPPIEPEASPPDTGPIPHLPPPSRSGILAAFRTAARRVWERLQIAVRPAIVRHHYPPLRL